MVVFSELRATFAAACLAAGLGIVASACGGNAPAPSSQGAAAKAGGAPRWGMTAEQESAWQQVEAAADKEGSVTYYAQGTITPSQVPTFMDTWKKTYPNIKIDLVNGSTSDVQTRINTEQEAKTYVGDMGDISARSGLLMGKRGYTQKFVPPASQDPNVKWSAERVYGSGDVVADHMTWFPLWINTKLVRPEEEPKNHTDILDPKWKGKIIWYAPWAEGGGWLEYYQSKKLYGQEWVTKMAAQQPAFAQSTPELLTPLARGEYAITLGSTGSGVATQMFQNNQPIKALWLDDFVQGVPTGHIVLNKAPHPNAANVLQNWWISEEGQRFQSSVTGQFPMRPDIPVRDEWQKGIDHPKEHVINMDVSEEAAAQAQKESGATFKK
jgi:iron(III) transport system substrate-binding protein